LIDKIIYMITKKYNEKVFIKKLRYEI